jgi:hypothetical protein
MYAFYLRANWESWRACSVAVVDCTEEASDGDACVDVFVILEGSKLLRME